MKREHPFGRVRQDTVAQPMRNKKLADLCAEILERLTGEQVDVIPRNTHYFLVRCTGEKWVRT